MPTTPTPADPIPEDRIAGILARAAELDRVRRETISVDALRAAAIDAGISGESLDLALEEYAAGRTLAAPRREARRGLRFAWLRRIGGRLAGLPRLALGLARRTTGPLKLGALAFFVAGVSGVLGEAGFLIGFGFWLFFTGRLVLKYRPERRARGFVARLVTLTIGAVTGFAAAGVDEDAIAALAGLAAPALAAGVLAIKVRLPRRFRSRLSAGHSPAA